MKKEKVLEIEITKINEEWSVFYISYQNTDILKRGNFKDDELNVRSINSLEYINGYLFLLGNFKDLDKKTKSNQK